jgi:hypothetical protein
MKDKKQTLKCVTVDPRNLCLNRNSFRTKIRGAAQVCIPKQMPWKKFVVVCQHYLISVAIRITTVSTGNCKGTIFLLFYKFLTTTSSLTTQTLPMNFSVDLAAKFLTSGVIKVYKNYFQPFLQSQTHNSHCF